MSCIASCLSCWPTGRDDRSGLTMTAFFGVLVVIILHHYNKQIPHSMIVGTCTGREGLTCYDCAWLSLTALSTITCNLWL
jgi:hypothetical protein